MEIQGHILNGVVVLDADPGLPDGTAVTVTVAADVHSRDMKGKRLFPVVSSKLPGSVDLTNDRIAEILDEDDVSN